MTRWEKVKAFNTTWNDLPRRLMWIAILLAGLFLTLSALPFVAPFVLAALFSWLIEPAVRAVTGRLGGQPIARKAVAAVFVVLIAGTALVLLMVLIGRLFEEVRALAVALPGWVASASADVFAWLDGLDFELGALEVRVEETLTSIMSELSAMLTTLASRIASLVARGAWAAAASLPQVILFIVLTLMGTFYMSADRQRIQSYVISLLPERYRQKSNLFRLSLLRAIFGQLRAAMIMLLVTFAELTLGFLLMGLDYAFLFAALIALLDALPVIGAGLFLIPMSLYGFVVGNLTLGIGTALIYLMTIVMRQLLEPRIIGRQLGLYPLATMMAMYAGLRVMGFAGMLLGPLMLLLCKVVLTADQAEAMRAAQRKPLFGRRKNSNPPAKGK
ncbi:MAG: sporulation integral membrane protein YtvI [Oscillospiraceae bacterium]|jgi:sporulation integral membrane protein YtvI|nr:sporulation integral membrane protein YtvI [Oscillospiraceae bacterium]